MIGTRHQNQRYGQQSTIWQLPLSTTQIVIIVSGVMLIVVVALASSSLLFFTFIFVIAPPPHDPIPPLPSAQWPDGAVVAGSIHGNGTKNLILAKGTKMPAHADCQGQHQHHPIGVVLVSEMSGIVIAVDIACRYPVASPCTLSPSFSLCHPLFVHPSS
jgi:hypothetical protein